MKEVDRRARSAEGCSDDGSANSSRARVDLGWMRSETGPWEGLEGSRDDSRAGERLTALRKAAEWAASASDGTSTSDDPGELNSVVAVAAPADSAADVAVAETVAVSGPACSACCCKEADQKPWDGCIRAGTDHSLCHSDVCDSSC